MRKRTGINVGNFEGVAPGLCPEERFFPLNRMDQRFFMQRVRELFEGTPFGCRVAWEEIPHLKDSDVPALSALYHQWLQSAQNHEDYISDYFEHAWALAPADGQPVFSSMVVGRVDKLPAAPLMTFYVDVTPWRDGDSVRGVNLVFKRCVLSKTQNDWAQHFFAEWATRRDVAQKPYNLAPFTREEDYARALRVPAIRRVLETVREQAFNILLSLIASASDVQFGVHPSKYSPHCPSINNTALLAFLRAQIPDVELTLVSSWGIAPSPEDGHATTDAIYTGFTLPPVESFLGMARMTTLHTPDCTGDLLGFRRVAVNSDHAMAANVYGPNGDPILYLALPFRYREAVGSR